ncbi:MAG: hypothetical protein GX057_01065 [Clostridiales bacterium]|nr:hypothetical protein [Clostridiales bacterium]
MPAATDWNLLSIKNSDKIVGERMNHSSDRFFFADCRHRFGGIIEKTVNFLTNAGLKDVALWRKFANQYRLRPDGKKGEWRGEFWGKMMRGAVLVWQYSRDEELYDILTGSVEDILTVSGADGKVTTYDSENEFSAWDIWCRKYVMLGLEYYLEICRSEDLRVRIIEFLRLCADGIMEGVGYAPGKKHITECSKIWYGINSSSVLEPFVLLYELTENTKYLDFATYIVESGGARGINIFELALKNEILPYQYGPSKAYEMISCFEGLAEYYRVTKKEKYRRAVLNFARAVLDSEVTIIGSCGCTHELFDHSAARQTTDYDGVMQETCVTVTWMKFCSSVLRLAGEGIYADMMESSFYNAYLGAVNTKNCICSHVRQKYGSREIVDTCLPHDSYSPLVPGSRGRKVGGLMFFEDGSYYGCCASIGAAGIGIFLKTAFLADEEGIIQNFYLAGESEVFWQNKKIRINMDTDYPAGGNIKIRIRTEEPQSFALRLRIPRWSESSYTVLTDAGSEDLSDGYLCLRKMWHDDSIELKFDMEIRMQTPVAWEKDTIYTVIEPGTYAILPVTVYQKPSELRYVAFRRGPITLCADSAVWGSSDFVISPNISKVKYVPENELPGIGCIVACALTDEEDNSRMLIDYASAGKEWGTVIAAWIPTDKEG